MFSLLPSVLGIDDVRALVNRVDTARHHGIPNGCVLELNLRSVPPETTGFDPLTIVTGGGRPMALRDAVAAIHRAAEDPRVAGLIARVQLAGVAGGRGSRTARSHRGFQRRQAVTGVGRNLSGHAVVLPGFGVRRSLDAALGKRWAGRFRQQCHLPARRARQGGNRSPVHRARRIQVGGKPFHRRWLHRSAPRGRHPDVGKPAGPGVAGARRIAQHRRGRARCAGRPGTAIARRRRRIRSGRPHRIPRRGLCPYRGTGWRRGCFTDDSDEDAPAAASTCRATPGRPGRRSPRPCRRFPVAAPSR